MPNLNWRTDLVFLCLSAAAFLMAFSSAAPVLDIRLMPPLPQAVLGCTLSLVPVVWLTRHPWFAVLGAAAIIVIYVGTEIARAAGEASRTLTLHQDPAEGIFLVVSLIALPVVVILVLVRATAKLASATLP